MHRIRLQTSATLGAFLADDGRHTAGRTARMPAASAGHVRRPLCSPVAKSKTPTPRQYAVTSPKLRPMRKTGFTSGKSCPASRNAATSCESMHKQRRLADLGLRPARFPDPSKAHLRFRSQPSTWHWPRRRVPVRQLNPHAELTSPCPLFGRPVLQIKDANAMVKRRRVTIARRG